MMTEFSFLFKLSFYLFIISTKCLNILATFIVRVGLFTTICCKNASLLTHLKCLRDTADTVGHLTACMHMEHTVMPVTDITVGPAGPSVCWRWRDKGGIERQMRRLANGMLCDSRRRWHPLCPYSKH